MAPQTSNHKAASSKLTHSLPSAARGRVGEGPVESPPVSHFTAPSLTLPHAALGRGHAASRQGVILLVLLGMLALFTATAFAFVVIASHGKKTSEALKKVDRVQYTPKDDLEAALRQAFRDNDNPNSVLRTHSLLRDLYGNDTIGGWVINRYTVCPDSSGGAFSNPKDIDEHFLPSIYTPVASYQSAAAGGQIIEFTAGFTIPNTSGLVGGLDYTTGQPISGSPPTPSATVTIPASFGDAGVNEYTVGGVSTRIDNEGTEFSRRVGCVLTVIDTSSALYNKSTRIVGYRRVPFYDPSTSDLRVVYHRYQILPFKGVSADDTVDYFGATQSSGDNFIINGVPFSGTGVGYRTQRPADYMLPGDAAGTADNKLDQANSAAYPNTSQPYALLPNPTDPDYLTETEDTSFARAPDNPPLYFVEDSTNEDYDAPDYQNMLLALEQWDGTAMLLTRSPSLHRPALANYWLHFLVSYIRGVLIANGDSATTAEIKAWTNMLQPYGADGVRLTADDPTVVSGDQILKIKRRCLLRPLREDHPNFDASNATNWPDYSNPIHNTLSYPPTVTTPAQQIAWLEHEAQRTWGALDLTPVLTTPWAIDTDNNGYPDDVDGDGVPDTSVVPWDVDTTGDSVPDSVWVDAALPIRTLADGRKYKPLVALHCIDMDGKLNLNAAGSTEQLDDRFYSEEPLASYFTSDGVVYSQNLDSTSGPASTYVNLQRGQGCGPPEINLYPMFLQAAGSHSGAMALYRRLLLGYYTTSGSDATLLDGRYGELWQRRVPYSSVGTGQYCRPAPGFTLAAGVSSSTASAGTPEARSVARLFGYPGNYYDDIFNNDACAYGLPMDLKGGVGIGLDIFGRPQFSALRCVDASPSYRSGWNSDAWELAETDIPYEMMLGTDYAQGLGQNANIDNPFSIAELESILRYPDSDARRLPSRLRSLINAGINSPYRRLATTDSWDIPTPAVAMPPELVDDWEEVGVYLDKQSDGTARKRIRRPLDIGDIIAARAYSLSQWTAGILSGITYPGSANPVDARRIDLSKLLCTELLAGRRMDLNRPFGNGLDDAVDTDGDGSPDSGNGVVDEPTERLLLAQLSTGNIDDQFEKFNADGYTFRFDHDNDGNEWRDLNSDMQIDNSDHQISIQEHIPGGTNFDPVNSYRQAYARHLYILMMALVDEQWYPYWAPEVAPLLDAGTAVHPHVQQMVRARAIAQWAVNVVDFRDPDSIMTPFEYDIYPFGAETSTITPGEPINTWDVDGDLTTTEVNSGVVWGCERPELLMTETLAFHDYKAVDADGDGDLDQKYRPEGSLFLELYNPQSPTTPKPAELYDSSYNGVLLTKLTSGNSPVWRVAVTTRNTTTAGDVVTRQYFDPEKPDPAQDEIITDRVVYFVPDAGNLPQQDDPHETYYPSTSVTLSIAPQRYAVIGPGSEEDRNGTVTINKTTLIGPATTNTAKQRRIILDDTAAPAVQVYGDGQTEDVQSLVTAGKIQAPAALVIDQPARLSVSEPTSADTPYPAPTWDSTAGEFLYPAPADELYDYGTRDLGGDLRHDENLYFFGDVANGPKEETFEVYRYVHLQRLADPMRDWDAATNPYITVDTMPVDLSVFNSKDESDPPTSTNFDFYTRQRGEIGQRLWKTLPSDAAPWHDPAKELLVPDMTAGDPTEAHVFAAPFSHSLGYVNHCFGEPLLATDYGLNASFAGAPGQYSGGQFQPHTFAWLTWLNRPFANPTELLQVPATSPSQLLMSFEYDSGASPYLDTEHAFGHLADFFNCVEQSGVVAGKMDQYTESKLANVNEPAASDFYRLLEYVDVPSRFVSSYIHGRPGLMVGTQLRDPGVSTAEQPLHAFHPPYNNIPIYREPGKINLNTLVEPQVLAGLMNDHMAGASIGNLQADWSSFLTQDWAAFAGARQAFSNSNSDYLGFEDSSLSDVRLPTRMANPFRSFAGYQLVPQVPGRDSTTELFLQQLLLDGVNSTRLRPAFNPSNPLDPIENRLPLVRNTDTLEHRNSAENPYFRHLPLQRLSNLTTNRSNVYALWIVVGYFEVEKYPDYDPTTFPWHANVYTDGYTIGQELGIDTGDVTRHRAFYVIDRSIPVGFVPGEDLNTEDAILLRRFIE